MVGLHRRSDDDSDEDSVLHPPCTVVRMDLYEAVERSDVATTREQP